MPELTATAQRQCHSRNCNRPARMSMTTSYRSVNKRRTVVTMIYHDDRDAPPSATPYCRTHGKEIAAGCIIAETDMDDDEEQQ